MGGDQADRTLYVGNLHPKTTEELLFELFLQVSNPRLSFFYIPLVNVCVLYAVLDKGLIQMYESYMNVEDKSAFGGRILMESEKRLVGYFWHGLQSFQVLPYMW